MKYKIRGFTVILAVMIGIMATTQLAVGQGFGKYNDIVDPLTFVSIGSYDGAVIVDNGSAFRNTQSNDSRYEASLEACSGRIIYINILATLEALDNSLFITFGTYDKPDYLRIWLDSKSQFTLKAGNQLRAFSEPVSSSTATTGTFALMLTFNTKNGVVLASASVNKSEFVPIAHSLSDMMLWKDVHPGEFSKVTVSLRGEGATLNWVEYKNKDTMLIIVR